MLIMGVVMIDVEFVQNQCETAIKNGYGHLPVIECGNAVKINELITRLREAEKDAARYRWLRNESIEYQDYGPVIFFSDVDGAPCSFYGGGSIISGDDADKAIDEAMQCK